MCTEYIHIYSPVERTRVTIISASGFWVQPAGQYHLLCIRTLHTYTYIHTYIRVEGDGDVSDYVLRTGWRAESGKRAGLVPGWENRS